ncbi:hypothetical protein VT06_15250 [Arsukibacterium sp. MJ3]|uniref:FAD/NAD(P)-binding protein n=1 Tax=Arsukibacterium sp. MJ3 TaxID=1632859 RepID=UPI0006273D06|nr:FAD/NAD(P)-binding protein [Arsukibacterium sp. MJ3]KKO47790.1 hypothetical protein VT06_15250 [Arsukibacterium sp. MJ3]
MKDLKIALVGGGPSALFMVKKLLDADIDFLSIDIFESADSLGKGMPYSIKGALESHISNVSSDEIPPLIDTLENWIKLQSEQLLSKFELDKSDFHNKEVVPRLLLGSYLENQFAKLILIGEKRGYTLNVHLNSEVCDIEVNNVDATYSILLQVDKFEGFDKVVICTGHLWPKKEEVKVAGFFNSPYPPQKLNKVFNHSVALKGSSLTAIDAIRTLSQANGRFIKQGKRLIYQVDNNSEYFKIVMYTLDGLLPSVRYHLGDPLAFSQYMMSDTQIQHHRANSGGFVSLDFLFESNFKMLLKKCDPDFYKTIADKNVDLFAQWVLSSRKGFESFTLLKIEYIQAGQSIRVKNTIPWKKLFALLSYSINYPAKYLSGEDMIRLHNILQPLIAIIIADIPQSSAQQLLALYECGRLDIIPVDKTSQIQILNDHEFHYYLGEDNPTAQAHIFKSFIDCTGQKPYAIDDFPFTSMFENRPVAHARVRFKSNENAVFLLSQGTQHISLEEDSFYYLNLQGFAINDYFQFLYADGSATNNCFMMAVPFISGFNPDYSGFDFCDQVSTIIVEKIKADRTTILTPREH